MEPMAQWRGAYDVPATWADRCTGLHSATVPAGISFPDTGAGRNTGGAARVS